MLRLGIVDFDSSHSIEFTQRFNHAGVSSDQFVHGARVVAGCPGTSLMAPERIDIFRPQVAACGVELVDQPEDLIGKVDGVLILSLCGTAHLDRVKLFAEHQLPLFVDKPFTTTLEDAREILEIRNRTGALIWTASGMRFSDDVLNLKQRLGVLGEISGVVSHGPGWLNDGNPGLLHYGIHSVEQAYACLGRGCVQVSCSSGAQGDCVTGLWNDGRQLTIRTCRSGSTAYGLLTFHQNGILHTPTSTRNSYRNLCQEIVNSFRSGTPPVTLEESVEVIQFILAALDSSRHGHLPVNLDNPAS